MSASLGLFRLQQIDRQIGSAQSRLESIRKTLEDDVELRGALSRLDAAKKDDRNNRHEVQMAEAEVQSQRVKIQQAESSLYGGNVHNPKELQDLQNDIASLKRRLSSLEDCELGAMEKLESAEGALKSAEADLSALQSRLGSERQVLLNDQIVLQKDLERLSDERQAAVAPIEEKLLETYEELRRQKRGVAVAEIGDNSCGACGARLTAALQQNSRSTNQIERCPTCGRILFAG